MSHLPNFVKVAVKKFSATKTHYSEEARQAICDAWRKSGLSMSQYCQQTDVALSSLSKWLRRSDSSSQAPTRDVLTNSVVTQQAVEIKLTNGIALKCACLVNVNAVVKLIQGISSCV